MSKTSVRFVAWSAYVTGAVTLVGSICLILFFTIGQPFGSLNDFFSGVIVPLAQLPLIQFFYHLHRARYPKGSVFLAWFGAAALLFFPVASVLVILKAYEVGPFAQAGFGVFALQLLAYVLAGIWLILVNYLSLATATLPRALAWLGIMSGLPLGLVCYPAWAIWFGHVLLGETSQRGTVRTVTGDNAVRARN